MPRIPVALSHRPEIDGLRAIAVMPVILFHAGFSLFRGGFVGVDVFFVISGYLITSIIIRDQSEGKFTIIGFYERRARRILPALVVVLLACVPFAWAWMMPDQLKLFAQSLAAVMLFSSNMLFWRSSGYFDPAAEQNPLLHTWSLGVEEQYYVVFPIFMLVMRRFGLRRVFWFLLCAAIASLGLSEQGWRSFPAANFFVAPTRAWEILLGSMLSIISLEHPGLIAPRRVRNNLLSGAGLLLILLSVFFYDDLTPFPSVYALVPTLGTALVLAFCTRGTLVFRLLTWKWVVNIGLISYSAYLWHQPLLAFARIRSLQEPSRLLMGALALGSLILAYLSWRFVETPFRARRRVSRRTIFSLAAVAMAGFVGIGVVGHFKDGFRDHQRQRALAEGFLVFDVDAELKRRKATLDANEPALQAPFDDDSKTKILVVGDSHANDFALAYLGNAAAFNRRYQVRRISIDETCFDKRTGSARTRECLEARRKLFDSGLPSHADHILAIVRWAKTDLERIAPFKNELGPNGSKLVIVGRTAEFFDVPSLLARVVKVSEVQSVPDLERLLAHYRVTSIDDINRSLHAEADRLGLAYTDKLRLICQGDRCAFLDEHRDPYFFDYGHWTLIGAKHFGAEMLRLNWLEFAAPHKPTG